jgi:DNA (cytosine-5)-methyltransferase 1
MQQSNEGVGILRQTLSEIQKIWESENVQEKSVYANCRIRRLTPTETERLQTFPDGWTAKGINEKGDEVEISDSQRYKMCGNAVTVNVVYEIAKRLE